MAEPETLDRMLRRAAADFPNKGIAIFDGRGREARRCGYPEVLARAEDAAARLSGLGVAPGDRLILSLETSWDLVDLWFGALLLGALPVNMAPGGAMGMGEAQLLRLRQISDRLGARLLFSAPGFLKAAEQFGFGDLLALARTPDDLRAAVPASGFAPRHPVPGDTAFLQLTSGSTGTPRAVVIPHAAAVHNPLASDVAIGAPHGAPAREWCDAMVSWLPLHHDMGLVGGLLFSLTCGFDLWLIAPKTFLARPQTWLRELGRRGESIAPAPNFAYQACVERVDPASLEACDLSRWRGALVGAEMIRPGTIDAFCRAFAARGFTPEQIRPCYGLAEGTLAVTFDCRGAGVRTRPVPAGAPGEEGEQGEVVCVGEAVQGTEVIAAAPDGTPLPEGVVGEVRARGPSIFAGYYGDPAASAECLVDGWLCTGDLGFMEAGELYLTGRTKDILIIHGQNLMPHELEWCAEAATGGGGSSRAGAFSIEVGDAGEQPVIVAEVAGSDPAQLAAMEREIRVAVGRQLGVPLADVVFVRRGRIPKTTSGKVQRRELRARYLRKELEQLDLDSGS